MRGRTKKGPRYLKRLRRRKRHPLHVIGIAIGLVMFWWGVWSIFDYLFLHNPLVSGGIAIFLALVIFFIDDFRIEELE